MFIKRIKKGLQKTRDMKTLQKLLHSGKADDVLLVGQNLYHIVEVGLNSNTRVSVDAEVSFATNEKGDIENYNDLDSIGHGRTVYYTNNQAMQRVKNSFNL